MQPRSLHLQSPRATILINTDSGILYDLTQTLVLLLCEGSQFFTTGRGWRSATIFKGLGNGWVRHNCMHSFIQG